MLQTKIKSSVGTANTQCKSLKSVAKVRTLDLHNFEPLASETGRKAFLSCFTASEKEFYIFQQCTYIVFSLQCQKAQTTDKMSKNSRNKHCSTGSQWCPLHCSLPSLIMNQVPENPHLG